MQIKAGDFSDSRLLALIRLHMAGMRDNSPAENVCGLDLSELRAPDIELYTVWNNNDALMGMGAIRYMDGGQAELKSMRTHPDHIRKGVAVKILDHLVAKARGKGVTRLSLETGSGPAFDASVALYSNYGFESGAVFGDYTASDFNQFFHMNLN